MIWVGPPYDADFFSPRLLRNDEVYQSVLRPLFKSGQWSLGVVNVNIKLQMQLGRGGAHDPSSQTSPVECLDENLNLYDNNSEAA